MRLLWLVLALLVTPARAGEVWRVVHEDDRVSVSVDMASLTRQKQSAIFRERHEYRSPQVDAGSLRRIAESQIRRQANCATRKLSVLSRASFSDQDVLVHYEAAKPEKALWSAPQGEAEAQVYELVCGGKP